MSDSKKQKLHFTPPVHTRDEVIAHGEAMGRLLDDTRFNLVVRSALQSYQDEWMNTSPEESKRREYLYNKAQALGDVMIDMATLANEAKALSQQELASEESNQRDYDQQNENGLYSTEAH